jgi:YihY family inner membrane protein
MIPDGSRGGLRGRIDRFQQRHLVPAFTVGVVRKFSDDRAGRLAALIAYYGFFSLFPALLAATSIVVSVVGDHDAQRLRDSALAQVPVIGAQLTDGIPGNLAGSALAVGLGLGLAIWAGLACMQAAQDAMNDVWDVPRHLQPGFVPKRLRSAGMLALVGASVVLTTFTTQVVATISGVPAVSRVGGVGLGIVIDAALFLVAFRLLVTGRPPWRTLMPGAVVGGIGYGALQLGGHWYVTRVVARASDTYGSFAAVLGLLSWLHLVSQLVLVSAEINVVTARHLWPRSIFPPKLTDADRVVEIDAVLAEQTRPEMHIDVVFGPTDIGKGDGPTAPPQ